MSSYKREKQDAENTMIMKAEASIGLVNVPAEETLSSTEIAQGGSDSLTEGQTLLNKVPEDSLDKLV